MYAEMTRPVEQLELIRLKCVSIESMARRI